MVRGKGKKSSETQRGSKGTEKGREGKEGERREEELNEGGREEREGEGLTKSLQCISGRAMASNAGPLALGQALASTHEYLTLFCQEVPTRMWPSVYTRYHRIESNSFPTILNSWSLRLLGF